MAVLVTYPGDPTLPVISDPEALAFPAWYRALREKLLARSQAHLLIENGIRLVFQEEQAFRAYQPEENSHDKIAEDLKAFAELEHRRSPFLTIELQRQGPQYILLLTGPRDIQEWLSNEFGVIS